MLKKNCFLIEDLLFDQQIQYLIDFGGQLYLMKFATEWNVYNTKADAIDKKSYLLTSYQAINKLA